jgi:glucan phosphoethanolaminetransferase (alkaline phosphatase superfamily)
LKRDSKHLINSSKNFIDYLGSLKEIGKQAEEKLIKNYENEHKKVDALTDTIINMLKTHSNNVKGKMLENLTEQRK